MSGSAEVLRADALALPLADATVDLVVTSPPYFGLRSYQDGGEHYDGQIGDEATPAEFVDALIAATAEMVRVLKPEGSIWVNLGDKYAGSAGWAAGAAAEASSTLRGRKQQRIVTEKPRTVAGAPTKSLIGVPWRYAIRCIDDLGLILRAEVIWSKPNGLPESVTDRVRRSHEVWFHFVKQPRYFSAVDEIREPHVAEHWRGGARKMKGADVIAVKKDEHRGLTPENWKHPLGKLPGSVWTIPTQPLQVPDHLGVDHFAAFPMEWPRRIIRGWSPDGICVGCGQGRRPVTTNDPVPGWTRGTADTRGRGTPNPRRSEREKEGGQVTLASRITITGYACDCDEPTADTTPAVVLDPFGGTGTTATVAKALGRHGISVDLSSDYCRLAEWRTNDPDQLAKAAEQPKPVKVPDGQGVLFS